MTTHFPSYDGIKSLLIGLTSALCNVFLPHPPGMTNTRTKTRYFQLFLPFYYPFTTMEPTQCVLERILYYGK